jgi:hypothetical protein
MHGNAAGRAAAARRAITANTGGRGHGKCHIANSQVSRDHMLADRSSPAAPFDPWTLGRFFAQQKRDKKSAGSHPHSKLFSSPSPSSPSFRAVIRPFAAPVTQVPRFRLRGGSCCVLRDPLQWGPARLIVLASWCLGRGSWNPQRIEN